MTQTASQPGPPAAELREVHGPSVLGGGRRRFFDLLWLVAVTNFKKAYFGTVLGYLWSLIRPLILFAVLLAVFTQIFRIGSEVENYPVLLLLNIVLFGFLQETTIAAVTSVVSQEAIVRKTQFPRLVIPLATVLTGLFNLGLNLGVVFIFILAYGVDPTWTWLLTPLIVALLFVISAALAMLLASLYVRYRDVSILWSVVVTVLFYGTPILYPLEIVPDSVLDFILLNPLTPIFDQARQWIIDPGAPGAIDHAGGIEWLIAPALIYAGVCALGVWVFAREAPRIAEEL